MQDHNSYVTYRNPETKVIQGMTDNGIDLRPKGARAGDAERDRAMDHVNQMLKLGFLKDSDASARLAFLETAEIKEQVALAIQDLPPLPEPEQRFTLRDYDFRLRKWYVPTLLAVMIIGLVLIFVPVAAIDWHVAGQAAMAAAFIVTGVVVFFSSLIGLCTKLEKHKQLYCGTICAKLLDS